jgi:O-antigen/teichoic acid export membrane protein
MNETSNPKPEHGLPAFDQHLKQQTRRSIFWTIGQVAGDQLFSFVVFVLLARLLDKPAIGTFAIAFVFMDIGRNFATAGVSQRIARLKSPTAIELDTIFWTNVLLAASYSLLIILIARPAERLFGAPQLASVLIWLAIPVMLSGASNTHMALRLREFGHRTLAVRSVVAGLLGGICAVVAALLGAGIWSLVLQRIVREAVCSVLAWSAYPFRPGLAFDWRKSRAYLSAAVDLGFAQVVTLLSLRAQDLGVARVLGPAPLSSYRVGWRCAELIGPQVVGPFAAVALQTFSRLHERAEQLRAAYVTMLQQCALVSVPALVGYAVAGPWLVPALFGPQWVDAGTIAPMLLPLALPFTINGFVLALLAACGRVKWQRRLALLDLLTTIIVTALAVSHGLRWLALTYSLRSLMLSPLQIYLVRRVSGIGFRDHLSALGGPIVASTVMGAASAVIFHWAAPASLVGILLLCAVSAVVYAAVVAIVLPQYGRELRRLSFLHNR